MSVLRSAMQIFKEIVSLRESAILSKRVDRVAKAIYDESECLGVAEPWEKETNKNLWRSLARAALGLDGASTG